MPVDLKNGKTLVCPTCGEEIRVAWLVENGQHTGSNCFCSCKEHGFTTGYTEDELLVMIKEQEAGT